MSKKINVYGGGAQTNKNGLKFEQTTSLDEALSNEGYTVCEFRVFKNNKEIGWSVPKHKLYKEFLEPKGIKYKEYNSKKYLPDECFINNNLKTAYIIEKKFQNSAGSVDEKLSGCHFKKRMYQKLFKNLDYKVEYLYVLSDWFDKDQYKDVLEYIRKVKCHYFFNTIPISFLKIHESE